MSNSKQNFWQSEQPLSVLAPMANVTDAAFRRMIAKYGKPDVMYTQFVPCDGLCSPGRDKLLPHLWYDGSERPIVAQFFGSKPENFYHSAKLAVELGFDGIDINMGCPDHNVLKQNAGSGLIKFPELAKEIIQAAKEGAGELPVSVKTRIGFHKIEYETWLPAILEEDVAALIVHLRTKKEMSKVDAHWELASDIAQMAHAYNTPIIGNGDVYSMTQLDEKCEQHNLNGVMMGRAVIGNPWCFDRTISKQELSMETVLGVMLEHARLFDDMYTDFIVFAAIRKHLAAYVKDFYKASSLRAELIQTSSIKEIETIVEQALLANSEMLLASQQFTNA